MLRFQAPKRKTLFPGLVKGTVSAPSGSTSVSAPTLAKVITEESKGVDRTDEEVEALTLSLFNLALSASRICEKQAKEDLARRTGTSLSSEFAVSSNAVELKGNALVEQLPGTRDLKHIIALNDSYKNPNDMTTPLVRTSYQVEAHRKIFKVMTPTIYGDDIDRYPDLIKDYWQYDDLGTHLAIMWPRRDGKSWSGAIAMSSSAYVLKGKKFIVCSTGERISAEMTGHMLKFFFQLTGSKGMIAKMTVEHLIITPSRDPNDTSAFHIYFLPCSPDKIRGISADVVFIDEAGFTKKSMLTDVILPLDSMVRVAVIMISSPPTSLANFFYRYFDLKQGDGKKIYDTLRIQSMCETCQAEGLDDCLHKKDRERAPWKSLEKEKEVRAQYGDDKKKLRRELYGMTESDDLEVFRREDINRWHERDCFTFEFCPQHVFVTIDLAAGGNHSDTAFFAGAFNNDDVAVVSRFFSCSTRASSAHTPKGSHRESQR